MFRLLAIIVFLGSALNATVAISAHRCEGGIVSTGDSKYTVCAKCGEPNGYVKSYSEVDRRRGRKVHQRTEKFIYDYGPQRLVHVLYFVNGRLQSVDTNGYGTSGYKPKMKVCYPD